MNSRLTYFASLMALIFAVGVPLACEGEGGDVVEEPVCGDGIMEGDEECDTDDFGGRFCSDENPLFVGGYLYCLDTCVVDVAHCELPVCGDDNAEGNEECDGYDMGDQADCRDHGFRCGYTSCNNEDCTINTDDCVLEIPCDTVNPILVNESAIGGYVDGGTEYSYIYSSVVDMSDTRTWIIELQLWGDQIPGGITTDPYVFTEEDLVLNLAEASHLLFLFECMDTTCDPPLKYYVPKAGTLQLSSLGQAPDGVIAGTMDDIEWKQIRVDGETGDASSVECGPCFALDASHTFDATVAYP